MLTGAEKQVVHTAVTLAEKMSVRLPEHFEGRLIRAALEWEMEPWARRECVEGNAENG